jgi:hypothetical protein
MANILRLNIGERWSALEFGELMGQLQFIADAALFAQARIDGQTSIFFPLRRLRRVPGYYYDPFIDVEEEMRFEAYQRRVAIQDLFRSHSPQVSNQLEIKRTQYGSPGFVDLAGIGKVVEQVRMFMTDIMDRYLHREDREIARESAAQDVLAKKIRNAEALMNLYDKAGLGTEAKRVLIAEVLEIDYSIEGKLITGQITSIESPPE